jgi:delta24-sterol reductase
MQSSNAAAHQEASLDKLAELLARYRWLFVVPVLLPLSTLFNLLWGLRSLYHRRLRSAPERHDSRVRGIQEQIARWHAAGRKGRLCTSRPAWMSISTRMVRYKTRENAIAVDLYDVLEIDTDRRIVRVEPRVTIGQLIDRLVPMGWTLPVMPELEDLTVGGLFVGYGVEVSSHRCGLFSESVAACDVVLGDGRLVRASSTENADLFNALPWSQGSLGFVVSLDLRIVPAHPYVHVVYQPVRGLSDACEVLARGACGPEAADFVEGIVFSRDEAVIMTARFSPTATSGRIHAAHRWYQPWFAGRSRQFLETGPHEEFVPLVDYYRRHVRGMYWESELIVPFGNNALFRYLLGWMMPPKIAFLRLTQGERLKRYYDQKHVIQDALVPIEHLEKTLSCFDEIFEAYPVWLCPMRLFRHSPSGFVKPGPAARDSEMYVDVAVIAVPGPVLRGEPYNALHGTRRMEQFLLDHRGYQAMYATSQLTREEFRRMFDLTLYDDVRRRYAAAGALMDVYDKIAEDGRRHPSG